MSVHMLHWKGPLMKHPSLMTTASPLCSPGVVLPLSTRATYMVTWHFWKSEAILRRLDKTWTDFSQLRWKRYLLRWSFYLCSGSAARWGCSAHFPLATAAREAKPSQCCRLQQQHSIKALLLCSSSDELHLGRYGWFLWQTAASNMCIWVMFTIIILKVKMGYYDETPFPLMAWSIPQKLWCLFGGISLNRTAPASNDFPRMLLIRRNPTRLIHYRTAH